MHQQAEHRPDDPGQDAASRAAGRTSGQRDDDEALEREAHERAGREAARLVRGDEREPHEQQGEDRERRGDARVRQRPGRGAASARVAAARVPVAPQPPHVAAERLGEQRERDDEGGLGQRRRQDVRGRDRQHDALRRRDDLAPVARRQRLRASTAAASRPPGTRSAPRRSRAPTRRPSGRRTTLRARIRNASTSPSKRAPSARRRPRAPRDPAVDRVEHERDGRERHEQRDRRGSANESAISAATPTASVARASVTQSAGPSRSER